MAYKIITYRYGDVKGVGHIEKYSPTTLDKARKYAAKCMEDSNDVIYVQIVDASKTKSKFGKIVGENVGEVHTYYGKPYYYPHPNQHLTYPKYRINWDGSIGKGIGKGSW